MYVSGKTIGFLQVFPFSGRPWSRQWSPRCVTARWKRWPTTAFWLRFWWFLSPEPIPALFVAFFWRIFRRCFVDTTGKNQMQAYKSVGAMKSLVSEQPECALLLAEIFKGNFEICRRVAGLIRDWSLGGDVALSCLVETPRWIVMTCLDPKYLSTLKPQFFCSNFHQDHSPGKTSSGIRCPHWVFDCWNFILPLRRIFLYHLIPLLQSTCYQFENCMAATSCAKSPTSNQPWMMMTSHPHFFHSFSGISEELRSSTRQHPPGWSQRFQKIWSKTSANSSSVNARRIASCPVTSISTWPSRLGREGWVPIYGNIKHVPNYQAPVKVRVYLQSWTVFAKPMASLAPGMPRSLRSRPATSRWSATKSRWWKRCNEEDLTGVAGAKGSAGKIQKPLRTLEPMGHITYLSR